MIRFSLVTFGLVAIALTGCMTPIVLRNPANGEVAQCLATGAFPLINQQQCASAYENMGWERTTAPAARQAQQQQIAQRDAEVKAALEECRDARLKGTLKSYLASAQCSNPRIREAYQRSGYPFMDLIDLRDAVRAVDAEKIDKGQMTEAEAMLHFAQVNSQVTEDARRRLLESQAVQTQANAASAQAAASQQQLLLEIQKQNSDNFNAQQQRQADIFRAGMPQPRQSFTCQTFGNTTNCY
jgi:hypothetical protein